MDDTSKAEIDSLVRQIMKDVLVEFARESGRAIEDAEGRVYDHVEKRLGAFKESKPLTERDRAWLEHNMRDQFAAAALAALVRHGSGPASRLDEAEAAYAYADAMMVQRKQTK